MGPFMLTLLGLYLPARHSAGRHAGQSLTEYALIIVLIAVAVIAAMSALSGQIQAVFNRISASLGAP